MFRFLIIGAGIAGCSIARLIINNKLGNVLIVEKRNHIGGNCYDYYDNYGILVHKYGAHIFHTNNKLVWDFLSRFTDWNYYQHRVLSYSDGKLYPFPPIEKLDCIKVDKTNAETFLISKIGQDASDKFYRGYSKKHWGVDLKDIDYRIMERIVLRNNDDTRYFKDKYQGLPLFGYTKMFQNMIDHKNIKLLLNTDYEEIKNQISFDILIYTGRIDDLFSSHLGRLEFKSRYFEFKTYCEEYHQQGMVINYPNDYDFIRSIEIKYATGQKCNKSTVVYEYPIEEGEPCYPTVINKENIDLYKKYKNMINKQSNIFLLGRLAEYKYFNIDQVVDNSFNLIKKLK